MRTLKPIDRDAIAATVKKTHRMVFTEEGWPQSGVGSEIIAIVNEEAFVRPRPSIDCTHMKFLDAGAHTTMTRLIPNIDGAAG